MREFTIRMPDGDGGKRVLGRARRRLEELDADELKARTVDAASRLKERASDLDAPTIKLVEAQRLLRDTRERLESSYALLEDQHDATHHALEHLGRQELEAYEGPLRQFADAFGRMKNVTLSDIDTTSLPPAIADFDTSIADIDFGAVDALKAALASGGAGALSGMVTMAAVGSLATASSGTAIAGLSGAAATNATLAWLGGGSLAAGGGGMAAGAVVLGGLVAAPVLAVGGLVVHRKGRVALAEAEAEAVEADVTLEQMELARSVARGIQLRAEHASEVLAPLATLLGQRTSILAHLVTGNDDYASYDDRDRAIVMTAAGLAKTVRAVIDVPLINEDGSLTRASRHIIAAAEEVLSQEGTPSA